MVASTPALAADALLVLESVKTLQENYVDQLDPVKLLNAGIQGLRKQMADMNVTADLPDLPAGMNVQDAQRLFMGRFASARAAAPAVNKTTLAYRAIQSIVELLDDSNTRFLTPEEYRYQLALQRSGYGGIGVIIATRAGRYYIRVVIPGGPAEAAGVRPFDRIDKIGDVSMEGKSSDQVVNFIRGITGTPVSLTLRRPGSTDLISVTMSRATIRIPAVIRIRVLRGGIGYVHLLGYEEGAASEFRAALSRLDGQSPRGLILDLRGGGSGSYRELTGVLDALLSPQTTAYITESRRVRVPTIAKGPQVLPGQVRLVVLLDDTEALSEVLAASVEAADRGLLVGTATLGRVNQFQRFELKDGSALEITTGRVLTARGMRLDKEGVNPDVFVSLGTEEFEAGQDPQLEEAIQRMQ